MSALQEITTLSLSRPALRADTAAVIAWYRAKGQLHEHLAVLADDPVQELGYAAAAYAHLRQMRFNDYEAVA